MQFVKGRINMIARLRFGIFIEEYSGGSEFGKEKDRKDGSLLPAPIVSYSLS